MAKMILHTDSGMPYVPSNFIPDNGLAGLAGSLSQNGHYAEIIDRNTLGDFDSLVPSFYKKELGRIYDEVIPIFSKGEGGKLEKITAAPYLARLWLIDRKLSGHRRRLAEKRGIELAEKVEKDGFNVVGFKYFLGSIDSTIPASIEIKKRNPNAVLIAGGPLVDMAKESPGAIFEANPYLDIAVFGEGEETIVDIGDYVDKGKELKGIPNTIYRDGSESRLGDRRLVTDLDSLAYPVYESYPGIQFNIKVFEMNRGCYGECPFCVHQDKSGNRRRTKSTQRAISEIERLMQGGTRFLIDGSSNPSFKRAYDVAKEINRKGLDVKYVMFGSALEFKEEYLKELVDSGLFSIFFGLESGDSEMLESIMRKGSVKDYEVFLDKLEAAVYASRDAGIYPVGSIIYPPPFGTREGAERTKKFVKRVFKGGGSVPANFAGLYPNSIWGGNPEEYGFRMKVDYPHGYVMRNSGYKIKTLFPPPLFWEDPGYEYFYFGEYHPFKEFAKETGRLRKDLSRDGITVGASHDTIFIGHLYDESMHPSEFIDMVQRALFTGDAEKMGEIIGKVNERTNRG